MEDYLPVSRLDREKPVPASASNRRAKYKKAPGYVHFCSVECYECMCHSLSCFHVVEYSAPKRFKSAFIFFSTEKHKEIRAEMGTQGSGEKVGWMKLSRYICICVALFSHYFHSVIDYQRGQARFGSLEETRFQGTGKVGGNGQDRPSSLRRRT